MPAPNSLTVKHVDDEGGVAYVAATSVQIVSPPGAASYLLLECGDEDARRRASGGRAYIFNAAGKLVDVIILGEIAPAEEGAPI